jgi:polyphosphate kinase
MAPLEPLAFHDPRLFINRELSWLSFNERVLGEAKDVSLPLYERLKFLGIVSTNLDEFFMVRVAGLKQQLLGGVSETPADGMLPGEQLAAIGDRVHALVADQYVVWNEALLPALRAAGVDLPSIAALPAEQREALRAWFITSVFPALTPLAVDPGHPFPHLKNKSMNVAVLLRKEARRGRRTPRSELLAVVQVPAVLDRLVPAGNGERKSYVLLEDVIAANVGDLFAGYAVKETSVFRVTRNWDLELDEDESDDLLSTVVEELRRRDRGAAVRLQVDAGCSPELERLIAGALKLGGPQDVYRMQGPMQLADLGALADRDPRPDLRVEPLAPTVAPSIRDAESMTRIIASRDLLLHHPYESFEPLVRFLSEAAEDPAVLAIKQTLYRTSGDSPFVRALARAAELGKQVTVLVEIKARFDEANNIAWARKLEDEGVHVVYGLIGLKTHCKVALVVRREGDRIRRYVHVGTGNYNPQTARQYTDVSLFTAREEITEDASALFNMLTGFADPPPWKRMAVAPLGLRERIIQLIEREAARARRGEPARIAAKMNALVDPTVIRALYGASCAGVEIDLVVRGICCLRPGVPGTSERIRVVSVVDRFLEHSRVFAFGAGADAEVYLSSADWMPRNFVRRIEVLCPVEDAALRARLLDEVLGAALADNVKARRLQSDGSYVPVGADGRAAFRSQAALLDGARRAAEGKRSEPLIRHVAAPAPAPTPAPRAAG